MVSIPVKLYTATETKDVSFNLLHKECRSRLKQLRWCPVHEREVPWDEVGRGYEYAKNQYVMMEEEDLENLPLASAHTIDLSAFVKLEEIDAIYYEKSYYLEPDEVGLKPFALLMQALRKSQRVAIGKIALRNKEHLCTLRPQDGALVLETMFYADEIRSTEELRRPGENIKLSERELDMADSLVELLAEPFDAKKYNDEYRIALMKVIESKLQGQEIEAPPPAPGKVTDLMAALKASVEAAKRQRQAESAAPAEGEKKAAAPAGRRRKAG
jgi:DNA end-binding protein Ku